MVTGGALPITSMIILNPRRIRLRVVSLTGAAIMLSSILGVLMNNIWAQDYLDKINKEQDNIL
jgi:hypothetical protein